MSQIGSTSHLPLSHQPSSLGDFPHNLKRQRVESNNPLTPVFSPAAQSKFETRIARITASVGFPLSWVENPEVIEFFQLFLPGAVLPTRGVLTRRLLANTLKTLQDAVWKPLHGAMGTLQADGWTGVNFHHLVGIMFAAAGSVHTVWVHDASDERTTARISLLWKVQQEINSPLLAIIRAVLTRWTSHYLAFTRLLEISGPLKLLVSQEDLRGPDNQIITSDSKAKARARAMVRTIKNDTFWAAIQR
ncbi:hypothetical protein HMN09_00052300 [Mycena chlorophos]|uniref:Uncharacterized protein n=1 Tax=Mycena chlorophos TaxID=658473 RepID=A0A8H6WS92_MYCCL|nr:hypothetical protein HMN09_00052300 [Mycena chlorophos]